MARVTIKGREFAEDVRSSLSKVSLQRKYGLSERGLQRAMDKMAAQGLLIQSDIDGCQWYEPTSAYLWTCPACGRPQPKIWDICPVCGVIVGRFEPKPQIEYYEDPPEQKPPADAPLFGTMATNFRLLLGDGSFWAVLLFAMLPLSLAPVGVNVRIALDSLLAALIWAVVFKKLIIKDPGGWTGPFSAMLFTAFVGLAVLYVTRSFLPPPCKDLIHSADSLAALAGWVVEVGVCEELCKVVPVFLYMLWKAFKREKLMPRTLVAIAVFSATGFAASENVAYAFRVASQASVNVNHGHYVTDASVKVAMLNYTLRAISLVFTHAINSGVFGCFLALAVYSRKFWPLLFVAGLGLSAGFHGLYDWLVSRQVVLAALTDSLCFVLFYSLVMIQTPRQNQATVMTTDMGVAG